MKYLILTVIGCLLAASCIINFSGSTTVFGDTTEDGIDYTEVREVGSFHSISSSLPCNIYFSQGDKREVRVESTEELAPKVLTTVENGTLKLKLEEGRYPKIILRMVITVPDVESIELHGSGSLIHEGTLQVSKDLSVKVFGSGDVRFGHIVCDDFDASASGSGDINIASLTASGKASVRVSGSGHARIQGEVAVRGMDLKSGGSGDIDLESVTASGNVSARTSGSGHIRLSEVNVEGDMDLKSSGSGDIFVHGSCRDITATTTGSGNISGNLSHAGMRVSSSGSGSINL